MKPVIYADDIAVYAQSTDRKDAGARINRYLDEPSPYLERKQLFVSTGKCASMLFSTWNKEWKKPLGIRLRNADIPTVHSLKLRSDTRPQPHFQRAHQRCQPKGSETDQRHQSNLQP